MSAFGELMGLQGHFVDQCDEAGIDLDVTMHKGGNSLSVQTGMYKRMADRERERRRDSEDVEFVLTRDEAGVLADFVREHIDTGWADPEWPTDDDLRSLEERLERREYPQ